MDLTKPAPPLYRLHVSTSCADRAATLQFCLDGGFLGVGWGVDPGTVDWATYTKGANDYYGSVNPSVRAIHDLPDGALIWTRDTKGAYYLAQVQGPWRYLPGKEARRLDMRNVRPAHIVRCGVDAVVPGKVANAFRAPRALQRINDDAAQRYSASLFAQLTDQPAPWHPTLDEVLTTAVTALDLEALVGTYLQRRHGYLMIAGSRPDTPAYEYVLRHPDDGHIAVVQVKTGWTPVPRDAGALPMDSVDRAYVFSATGTYSGKLAANVITLPFDALVDFMRDEPLSLPPTVEHWVRLASEL